MPPNSFLRRNDTYIPKLPEPHENAAERTDDMPFMHHYNEFELSKFIVYSKLIPNNLVLAIKVTIHQNCLIWNRRVKLIELEYVFKYYSIKLLKIINETHPRKKTRDGLDVEKYTCCDMSVYMTSI